MNDFENNLPEDFEGLVTFKPICLKYTKRFLYENFKENYPEIEEWFENKVIPDLDGGKRAIYTMNFNCKIVGILIVKFGEEKNKICSFYLTEFARNIGFGKLLFTFAVEKLKEKNIVVTVPEKRMSELYNPDFSKNDHKPFNLFLEDFGFEMVKILPKKYNDYNEYVFVRKCEVF